MARNSSRPLAAALLGAAGLLLAACIHNTAMDDLDYVTPGGDAFNMALYKNYAFLAHSFGDIGAAKHTVFDFSGSLSLNGTGNDVARLADAYAEKAVDAGKGEFVDPEISHNPQEHAVRDRLVQALAFGRDGFARDAARAQADYDCWVLNATIDSQKAAAERCRASLDKTLPLLEAEVASAQKAAAKAPQPGQTDEAAGQAAP
jgi:hypothetical protein